MSSEFSPRLLAVFLAALVALTPFSIDTYLPAIPAMATYFGTNVGMVEITIGAFFLGYALGQLVGGPLSDHYGRKQVGGPGLIIFLLATMLIIFAPTIEVVIIGRFIQAFGGGLTMIIAPSIVRDRYSGKEAARMFALIGVVMLMAPLLAPAIGSLILKFSDWRMTFVFLGVYAVLAMIIVFRFLPERKQALTGRIDLNAVWTSYAQVIRHPVAMGYLWIQTFSLSVLFLFVTGAAFTYISYLEVSPDIFPLLFGGNAITMMAFNRLNPFLLNIFSTHQLVGFGVTLQLLACAGLLGGQFIDPKNIWMVTPMVMLTGGGAGLSMPNSFACFLEYFEDNSGVATAVMGTSQFMVGGMLSALLGLFHSANILPMASLMLFGSVMAMISYWILSKRRRTMAENHAS